MLLYRRESKRGGLKAMTVRMRGKEFYTINEIVDILPIGRVSIAAYIRAGRIKGVKIGRLWYIEKIELDRFLDARYQENVKSLKKDIQS